MGLAALREVQWARQADEFGLYPTTAQIHLVDKKFGGKLPYMRLLQAYLGAECCVLVAEFVKCCTLMF